MTTPTNPPAASPLAGPDRGNLTPDPGPGAAVGPAERQVSTQAFAAGSARLRPLVRVRVRRELRKRLATLKRGRGAAAKALSKAEQAEILEEIGTTEIDAAIQEAESQAPRGAEDGRAAGPILDFLTSEKFIELVVSILLMFLGL